VNEVMERNGTIEEKASLFSTKKWGKGRKPIKGRKDYKNRKIEESGR